MSRSLLGLFILLLGCPDSPPTDDDDTIDDVDDDDATVDDDDATVDDDDATVDDDDATPVEPTALQILVPSAGDVLQDLVDARASLDGDDPGPVRWLLDGVELATTFPGLDDGVATLALDAPAYEDGPHVLRAEALWWDLRDEVAFEIDAGDLVVRDVGVVTWDPALATPQSVAFDVPDWAVSVQLQVTPVSPGQPESLYAFVSDPNADWAQGGVGDTLYRAGASAAEPYASTWPDAPTSWPRGTHRAYPVADDGSAGMDLSASVLLRRQFHEPVAGELSLALQFGPGAGITAVGAATDTRVLDFLDALETVFLQVGIALGSVSFEDLSNLPFNSVDDLDELHQLFRASAQTTDRVLPLFFVGDLDMPGSQPIGIAAHVPGPALASGTGQAGVAVISQYLIDGEAETAAALAGHEIGHFLGLYHPTEVGGGTSDPIVDTPQACDSSQCWATNLMDPYLLGDATLTPDQGWVMRRHPLVVDIDASQLPASARALPAVGPRPELGMCTHGGADGPPMLPTPMLP